MALRETSKKVLKPVYRFVIRHIGPVGRAQIEMNRVYRRNGRNLRWINLRKPERLSEKVIWLKINQRYPDAHILADKLAVRDHVAERIGADVLIPLAAVYDDPDDIDLDDFPEHFVVKPNHASGMVMFGARETADRDEIVSRCREWLSVDYGVSSGEYHYSPIPRRIMVEPDLRKEMNVDSMVDYKLFCFDGVPQFILVISGRFQHKSQHYYDMDWHRQPFSLEIPSTGEDIPPPQGFDFMKRAAARLSAGKTFVRVDFHEVNGTVLFGEITFFPSSGNIIAFPDSYDVELGKLLTLPGSGR